MDCCRCRRCSGSYGDRFRVSSSDCHRVGRADNFLGSPDNSIQYYCRGPALLGQDPSIERRHFLQWDKGHSCQGGPEVDLDQNTRGKHCYNRQQYIDEWTLHQLHRGRAFSGKTMRMRVFLGKHLVKNAHCGGSSFARTLSPSPLERDARMACTRFLADSGVSSTAILAFGPTASLRKSMITAHPD